MSIHYATAFDSPESVVAELLSGVGHPLPDTGFAILLCEPSIPFQGILKLLQEALPVPVFGGTADNFLGLPKKLKKVSASLAVINRDGIEIAWSVSPVLDEKTHEEQMRQTYAACREQMVLSPRMVICLFPRQPQLNTSLFASDIFQLAGQVPVFGGLFSDDLGNSEAGVFAGGQSYSHQLVLVMLAGNIKPAFAAANDICAIGEYAPMVTRSAGYTVYSVDGRPFCDYMQMAGLKPEDRIQNVDALMQYGPLPVEVLRERKISDGIRQLTSLRYTTLEDGSATFTHKIEEGARVKIGLLTKSAVIDSARNCAQQLVKEMAVHEKKGYRYSMVFGFSCVSRYFAITSDNTAEQQTLEANGLSALPLSGMYGFGEICPVRSGDSGATINRVFTSSLTLCAL